MTHGIKNITTDLLHETLYVVDASSAVRLQNKAKFQTDRGHMKFRPSRETKLFNRKGTCCVRNMNSEAEKVYLRCQNRKWPILLLDKARSRRNVVKSQSRYGSYFRTCTSCRRYWKSSSSLLMKKCKKKLINKFLNYFGRILWHCHKSVQCMYW